MYISWYSDSLIDHPSIWLSIGFELLAFCRSIAGCRCGVLYLCWQSNLSPSRSLTLYNLGEVSKSSSIFDVGLIGSIHRCCFYFLYHPFGLAYTLCGLTGLGLCPLNSFLFLFFPFFNNI
jgi:hypothetical protein